MRGRAGTSLLPCLSLCLCLALCLCLGICTIGCATIGPPQPPSLDLPKAPTDLHAVRKGNHVTLTWTIPQVTTDRQTIRALGPTRICRGLESDLTQCATPVGEVAASGSPAATGKLQGQKIAGKYVDVLPAALAQGNPSGFMTYAVEVLNANGRGSGLSNRVQVPSVATLPPLPNFAAQATAQGIRVSWSYPPPSGRAPDYRCLFRIYRREESSATDHKIADIDLGHCFGIPSFIPLTEKPIAPSAEQPAPDVTDKVPPDFFLDLSFEWEKTYLYRGTVVSVVGEPDKSELQVEGDDTSEIKIFAHDVFPPVAPSGLQAVFSGPGQEAFIDLVWAPVTDVDLAGYNVYRSEGGGSAAVKMNAELLNTPAYRDATVVPGKGYVYSVSAVDLRGNESAKSEEASENVP